MISSCKLPFSFNPHSLKVDLEQVPPDDWVAHFNKGYFEGQWTGVALRSGSGVSSQLYSDPRVDGAFAETATLDRCPNIRNVLALLRCPLRSVRFLRLAAGSIIREHRDYDLGYDEGQVRLHIPIITNPAVDFFLDAQRIEMKEGECWYLDLSLPHWVENRGLTDRVHLVIDCEVNEWIRELLASESHNPGMPIAPPANEEFASAPGELQRFRQIVLTDLNLQRRLRETADRESFTRLVVSIGQQGGYLFTAADVENAIEAARKTWLERWVE